MSFDYATPEDVMAQLLLDLERLKPDQWEAGELGDQARRLHLVRRALDYLRGVADLLEMGVASGMRADLEQVPGLGDVYRTEELRSTWLDDSSPSRMRDDLAHAVANKLSIDLITGEVDRGKRALILEAIRIAYEAIPSFSNLKVQGRKALGLRMDDYRTFDKVHKVKIQEAL
jgi:hypothetical protein